MTSIHYKYYESSCYYMYYRFVACHWKLYLYTVLFSRDGAPERKLSEKSNSLFEEGTSFEVGIQSGDDVDKKDDDDENYEEPAIPKSKIAL